MTNLSEQIIHVKTPITREDLASLVFGLEAACGGNRIEVTEVFDLVVKDDRQANALRALFGPNGKDNFIPILKRKPRFPSSVPVVHKKENVLYPKSIEIIRAHFRAWRVLNILGQVVEQITIEEKNRRLAAGEFEPDTILHHPKAGRQRVTGAKGQPQGLEPS